MRKSILFVVLSTLFFQQVSKAQSGIIKGVITDKNTGETLIGATVLIEGTTTGTITDFDGNYTINNLQPGIYNILCQYISYESQVVAGVSVSEDAVSTLNFVLSEALTVLEEVKVVAKKRRETEQMLLLERRESTIAVESIGSKELSRKGASNVASGVKKISGVSMIGNKQLFVRGLGDRYNSLQLNGLPLTSPDPSKKVIKLDLFSSDIVEALSVNKVFSVDKYADYTGALINIDTKDYPTTPFVKLDYSTGYNTQSSLDDFKRMDSQGNNFFGLSASKRLASLPDYARTYDRTDSYDENIFASNFLNSAITSYLNQGFGLSAGKLFTIGKRQLGVLVSASFENDFDTRKDITKLVVKADGTNESSFDYDSYEYGTNLSTLLSATYKHNSNNSVSYNLFYLNSSIDKFKELEGRDNENREIYSYYNSFENHHLINNQLFGNHELSDKLKLSWGTSFALSGSSLPDTRILKLQKQNDEYYFYTEDSQGTYRVNLELEESSYSGRIGIESKLSDNIKFLAGAQVRSVGREIETYIHYYDVEGISETIVATTSSAGELINDESFSSGLLSIDNGSTWDNKYEAGLTIYAGYVNYIHTLFNKLTVDAGLRMEISETIIDAYSSGGIAESVSLDGTDIFPAINLRYKINNKNILRFASSRTITRPSFHEMSPAKLPPFSDEEGMYGNYDLINSYSNNVEFKYEMFPGPGELLALGVYGKQIIDPIERITRPTGGATIFTYDNTEDGVAAGIEAEVKKHFKNIFAGVNLALIYTHVEVDTINDNGTNSERMLQGASPYLINADLGYEFKYGNGLKSGISVIYNVFGERIYSVGSDGRGDIYELPFHTFDILIQNKITKSLDINFKIKNALNSETEFEQDYYDATSGELLGRVPLEVYKHGTEYSISISYKF